MKHTVLVVRHAPHESGGTLENALAGAGLACHYVNVHREIPPRLPLDQAAGLVVLGGAMNADQVDQYPFLAADVRWMRQAVDTGLPLLGICLGAELLAKSLARVYPNGVKEIGWYSIEMTPAAAGDPVLAQSGTKRVFQWHGDTFDLPAGAVHLARSPQCENQAFRYGRTAYGLQFHVEMTAPMIDSWLGEPGNCGELAELPYIDPVQIRRETPGELPQLRALAGQILGRFAQLCRAKA